MCPAIVSFIANGHTPISYREEKSLRHVAMVAEFLDDNKPKLSLKSDSHCFKLYVTCHLSFVTLI